MRRLILVLVLTLFAAPALAQRDGLYDVAGTNLDGTPYTGVAQIRSVGLNSFSIAWRIGNTLVEGTGMASGRSVAVSYGQAQRPGLGIYQLNPDGSMDGEWTIVGAPAIGRERLVPRPVAPAGAPSASPPAGAPSASPPAGAPSASAPAGAPSAAPPAGAPSAAPPAGAPPASAPATPPSAPPPAPRPN